MLLNHMKRNTQLSAGEQRRPQKFICEVSGKKTETHRVRVNAQEERRFFVVVNDDAELEIEVHRFDTVNGNGVASGRMCFTVNGDRRDLVIVPGTDNSFSILLEGIYKEIRVSRNKYRALVTPSVAQDEEDWQHLKAPMPAVVTEILIAPGMRIQAEQPVLRLEAMKMIITLSASCDCIVDQIEVVAKQTVTTDQVLMHFRSSDTL